MVYQVGLIRMGGTVQVYQIISKFGTEGSTFALLVCLTKLSWNTILFELSERLVFASCCLSDDGMEDIWVNISAEPGWPEPSATPTHQYSLMTATSKNQRLDAKWTQYMNPVHIGQLLSFEFHHTQKQNSLMRPQVQPGPVMILQFFIIFNPLGFIHYFLPVTSECQARVDCMQRNIYLFLFNPSCIPVLSSDSYFHRWWRGMSRGRVKCKTPQKKVQ